MINFIVNTNSGHGKGRKTLKKIIRYCLKNKIEYTVHLTSAVGHATLITRALCQNDAGTIVAVGGDGTFHEVLNGIDSPKDTCLGFIPSGRGNDFARGQGIPLNPVKALKIILNGKTSFIDYIKVGGRRCLNVAGTGLDVDVLKRVDGKHGKLSYLKSLIYCLKHFDPYCVSVTTSDGTVKDYSCIVAAVCNGRQFGGGIKLSPLSVIDDGIFNVVIMNMPDDKRIFRLLPRFVKGKHLDMQITTHFTADKIRITSLKSYPVQLDGEIYENLDFECSIVRGGLKTFIF